INIDDYDDPGNINRTKSISIKTIANLKRRSSIRKSSLKLKGSKRISQMEDGSSSRKAFAMSETSPRSTSPRSFEMGETSPRSTSPRSFEMGESPRSFETSPRRSIETGETSSRKSFEMSEDDEKETTNTSRLGLPVVYPEHIVEVVHQDYVYNGEYVTYGNTSNGGNIQSNPVKEDTE
ncbi:29017_t:CDS:1, partial [Racocetra persica]